MDTLHIADLIPTFLDAPLPSTASKELPFRADFSPREPALSGSLEKSAVLSNAHLQNISMYIDILLRWNARINLTALRPPAYIVTRHFIKSLFAAAQVIPNPI